MNVLILGSGGREHTISWKVAQSKKLSKLYIAPGNAGTNQLGENISIAANDFPAIEEIVQKKQINMVIVGPEEPLVKGIVDYFKASAVLQNIPIIGPSQKGAMLEGSKQFAKEFMQKYNIPTAKSRNFTLKNLPEAFNYLERLTPPYVLKADGLAAGKGVLILPHLDEAKTELEQMLKGKFGDASKTVVIEEHLKGIEISVFVLTDGTHYKIFPEAKDYKRAGENNTGLNTGGMGAVSPVPFATKEFLKKVENAIIRPTIQGLQSEGIDYKGFIYFGLMNDKGNPWVVEYNVRMGDPEAEAVLPRLQSDLLDLFEGTAEGSLHTKEFKTDNRACTTLMLVSGGYPGKYEKGKEIKNIEKVSDSIIFHAGTKLDNGTIKTNGGRVISISSFGNNYREALETCKKNAEIIDFEGKYYRKDIGFDL